MGNRAYMVEAKYEDQRFTGSVLKEYLYRSPKRVAEIITTRGWPLRRAGVLDRGLRQSCPGNSVSETVSQY
jgi:hypothetical protein